METKTIKTTSVNAYKKKNGKILFVITLENGTKTFINGGLIAYAGNNPKDVKDKEKAE